MVDLMAHVGRPDGRDGRERPLRVARLEQVDGARAREQRRVRLGGGRPRRGGGGAPGGVAALRAGAGDVGSGVQGRCVGEPMEV